MPVLSIFPKFLQSLSAEALADRLLACGLDAVNLVVRPGYWVEPDSMASQTAAFCKTMRQAGLQVPFCTLGAMPAALIADPSPMQILADNGISGFRLGYYRRKDVTDLPQECNRIRGELQELVPILDRLQLRAIYQIHHATLLPSPSLAAMVVADTPIERLGVMLDPGNQSFEGFEPWSWAAQLLGERWACLGIKDTLLRQEADGRHKRQWVPCGEGQTNWSEVLTAYQQAGGDGPWVMMPFYHDKDPEAHLACLAKEVAYIRSQIPAASEAASAT